MPLDASIVLAGKPPVIDTPAQTIGDLMKVRALGAEVAQRQAETEHAKVQTSILQEQATQRQRDLESARQLQTIMQDPAVHESIGRGDFTPIWKSGVSPTVANPIIKQIQDMREKALVLDEKQASRYAEGRALLAKTIEGLDPNDEVAVSQWNAALPIISKDHPELGKQLQPMAPGPNFRQSLKQIAGSNSIAYQMLTDSAARAKEAAATREQNALAAGHEATTLQSSELHPFKLSEEAAKVDATTREQYAREHPDDLAAQAAALDAKGRFDVAHQKRVDEETARQRAETARHDRALEAAAAASAGQEGSATFMVPNPDGTYKSVRIKPGDSIPSGAVSASGLNSLTVPTAATRSMAEAAPKVISFVDRIEKLINEQEKDLGPASGRLREFLAGKIGAKDAEFTKLRTDVGLLQTALMRMHVGARGGSQMMEHFKDLIDSSKQDPDNMRAALGEIKEYANTVAGKHEAPPVTMIRARDAQGKLHEAPAGTPLPPGWKEEK